MKLRHYILGVAILASTAYGLSIPDAKGFRDGTFARILLTHIPCAFLASILLTVAAWFGFRYLRTRDLRIDVKTAASVELGTIFALLTMATGLMFSHIQWGQMWQNDPRQISFLFVCLFYVGLLALRSGFKNPVKQAEVTGAYALALLLPMLFLTFVFPRLPQVEALTFHPNDTLPEFKLDGPYSTALAASFVTMAWLAVEVYRFRVAAGLALLESQNHEPLSAYRNGAAPDGVVRPVALREKDSTHD